jgi:nicotinamide-nucleotide amidase
LTSNNHQIISKKGRPLIAEILSVGTELLLGQIVDTNAAFLAQTLSQLGISTYYRTTVGDNPQRLRGAIDQALSRSDVIITIGGLGPTSDDLTKETVAEAFGDPMIEEPNHRKWLEDLFRSRTGSIPQSNMKQALVPTFGQGIPNPNGTALGAFFEKDGKMALCLPGPPNEFIPMVEDSVVPILSQRTSGTPVTIHSRVLRVIGVGESAAEDRLKDLMQGDSPSVAPYAKTGEVHLRITARAESKERCEEIIAPMEAEIRGRLGDAVYGVDDETLEQIIVNTLAERKQTMSAAESCSGGLIAKRITDISGASFAFLLGIVAYANEAKIKQLGVPEDIIWTHGAVSPECARAMASGVRQASGADYGVSVTGIAGPDGGSPEKPVGTVHIGFSWDGGEISVHHEFLGTRQHIAQRAAHSALALLRQYLTNPADPIFAPNNISE